jgi:hypothetical protein
VQHDHLAVTPALDDAGAPNPLAACAVMARTDVAIDVVSDAVAFLEGVMDAFEGANGVLRVDRCDTRSNALFD